MSYFLSPIIYLGRKPEQLIPSFSLFRLFHKLYLAVTSGLLEKMATNKNHDGKRRVKKTSRQNAAKKAASSDDEMLENRFALLCDVGAEQGEDDDP